MVELMVSAGIFSFFLAGIFGLMAHGRADFFNADASIGLRNDLRMISEKMSLELQQTGNKAGVPQFFLLDGQGANGSDIVRFSVPVLCSAGSSYLDSAGNPACWGAPLTWGCTVSSCMDADDNCSTVEYKYVQYSLNASNQLQRIVLDAGLNAVAGGTMTLSNSITDLQTTQGGNHKITVILTGQKISGVKKTMTMTHTTNIVFVNNFVL